MKKFVVVAVIAAFSLSLVGCGAAATTAPPKSTTPPTGALNKGEPKKGM